MATQVRKRDFKLAVIGGPSRMDVFTSLITAMAKAPNQAFEVTFEIREGQELPQGTISPAGYKYPAVIQGAKYEDDSGDSLIIEGLLKDNQNGQLDFSIQHRFTGYYRTDNRKGFLELSVYR